MIHNLPVKLFLFIVICALPILGCVQMVRELNFIWPAIIYSLVSFIAFFIYWSDKRRAESGRPRFTENSLHLFELLGGWPGALLAQHMFRHKTRKQPFQLIFWLIVAVHLAFWVDWIVFRGEHAGLILAFLMGRK